jgi:hypothetical protein
MLRFFGLYLFMALSLAACSQGSSSSTPVVATSATWFVPEGSTVPAAQVAAQFAASQLSFNVPSADHSAGEIRGEVVPTGSDYPTDNGDPFAANPFNNPVTFAALLGGDQVRPRNVVSRATGYGALTVNPVTKQLRGFLAASGITGTTAEIRDALPGAAGSLVLTLEGGPVLWTVPANTVLSDAQLARLSAGAFYFSIDSASFPAGEIRGQLDQQVRNAALKGSNEVPPVSTSASAVGILAMKAATKEFSGFVKAGAFSSNITAVSLSIGAPGSVGTPVVFLANRGSGLWALPADTVLGDPQVASFNNGELFFSIQTQNHLTGEVRGQLLQPLVKVGAATLNGSKALPPVSTTGNGTGFLAWNSVTEQLVGSVATVGLPASATQLQVGSATASAAALASLSTSSPVQAVPVAGISYALDIQPIFSANCTAAFCHVSAGIGPMSLQPGVSYANVIPLLVPGDAASSYIITRLTGARPPRMPLNRPALEPATLQLIKDWIDNGARNN